MAHALQRLPRSARREPGILHFLTGSPLSWVHFETILCTSCSAINRLLFISQLFTGAAATLVLQLGLHQASVAASLRPVPSTRVKSDWYVDSVDEERQNTAPAVCDSRNMQRLLYLWQHLAKLRSPALQIALSNTKKKHVWEVDTSFLSYCFG